MIIVHTFLRTCPFLVHMNNSRWYLIVALITGPCLALNFAVASVDHHLVPLNDFVRLNRCIGLCLGAIGVAAQKGIVGQSGILVNRKGFVGPRQKTRSLHNELIFDIKARFVRLHESLIHSDRIRLVSGISKREWIESHHDASWFL